MARLCRATLAFLLAVVVARSSVTISWNTHRSAGASGAAAAHVQTGIVSSVRGTRVLLRLSDGTTRVFLATPGQARVLQSLVGTAIRFESVRLPR